jgi:lipoprotein-anchoring transpeptidase ErfK/SrfK
MDSDDPSDAYDHRDVPWVAYFSEGYALHAAYWHDDFGTPKSHGCVNLSPADARWLFQWTEPPVPLAWHGALGAGTRVVVAD